MSDLFSTRMQLVAQAQQLEAQVGATIKDFTADNDSMRETARAAGVSPLPADAMPDLAKAMRRWHRSVQSMFKSLNAICIEAERRERDGG